MNDVQAIDSSRSHMREAATGRQRVSPVVVRPSRPEDSAAVRELQRIAYPSISPWTAEQIDAQRERFPEGQMVAELDGRVVGASSSLIVQWDDYAADHTWKGITGDGTFSTFDPVGRTLYAAEVVVSRSRRGAGIGRELYRARDRLCERLGLRRIIAAGRLPGYHKVKETMSPELYAMRVVWGDIADPVLGFQLSQGFHYCGIIHNYLPEDRESCGHAALIVRLNRRNATRAALKAREAA